MPSLSTRRKSCRSTIPNSVSVVQSHGSPAQAQVSVNMQVNGQVPSAVDTAGASTLAGFAVLAPSYLPSGYSAMSDWLVSPQGSGLIATKGYRDAAGDFFIINEWRAGDSQTQEYARDTIVDVTVHGQPGVWLPDNGSGPGHKHALVWAENGITYSLVTDSAPLDEMMKTAEGLGK